LENCTTLCNLPFAARRLFDIHGTELFDLTSIVRDSYVYVSCGEQWIDPELTKAEQQRRLLLAYLSNDVRMIYFYCALRNPTGKKNCFFLFLNNWILYRICCCN
jgi:hypothetical protein